MSFLKFSIIFLSLLFSCNSTNKSITNNTEEEEEAQMESNKMTEAGFTSGTIVYSEKEGDCPTTIQVDGGEEALFYDPINIAEVFKNDGNKVWFKFTRLRMMNRCDKAGPIRIEEILERND